MSESAPKNSPERAADTFSSKKETVVAYLKKQIAEKTASHDSLEASGKSAKEYYKSTPPLGPIPDEVYKDGGSDLDEWRAQIGADSYEREHGDEDRREEMEELGRDLEYLENNLRDIEAMQEDPDSEGHVRDMRMLESYMDDIQKSQK